MTTLNEALNANLADMAKDGDLYSMLYTRDVRVVDMDFRTVLDYLRSERNSRLLHNYVQMVGDKAFEELGEGKEAEKQAATKARIIRQAYYTGKY